MSITVDADGSTWFSGEATCLLVANVPKVIGGMEVFPDADPENGTLEVGLVTAHGLGQWAQGSDGRRARTRRHGALRAPHPSSRDRREDEEGSQPYELDGGTRPATQGARTSRIEPDAINVMVPDGDSMSTANLVPETRDLTGDDAYQTLRRNGRRHLLVDAFKRLRVADGFSHARSLAFLSVLVVVQGTIALVGLASVARQHGVQRSGRLRHPGDRSRPVGCSCSLPRRARRKQAGDRHQTVAQSRSASPAASSPPRRSSGSSSARSIASTASRPIARPRRSTASRSCSLSSSARSSSPRSRPSRTAASTRVSLDGGLDRHRVAGSHAGRSALVLAAGGLALLSKWSPRRQPAALVVARVRSGRRHVALGRCHRAPRRVLPLELDVRRDLRTARRHRRPVPRGPCSRRSRCSSAPR